MPQQREQATDAAEWGLPSQVITLPVLGPGGKQLKVEVEAATIEELTVMMKGITGMGRDANRDPQGDPLDLTLHFIEKYGEHARPLVERYVKSPRITFDAQPGTVHWNSIHLVNRLAIVNAISELSQNGSVRRAERLATFLAVESGGRGDSPGAGAGVANGDAPAPEAQGVAGTH